MTDPYVTNFPMLGYRISDGGLGYRLEYEHYGEWLEIMDAVKYIDCLHAMHDDIRRMTRSAEVAR